MPFENISYINHQEIDRFYKLFDIKEQIIKSTSLTFEGSLFGQKISKKIDRKKADFDEIDKLYAVISYLDKTDLVAKTRPNDIKDESRDFILEKTVAHKLFFPKNKLIDFEGVENLIIWISEPDDSKLSNEPWTYTGTFLILIESIYDRNTFQTTISGCSALQALHNIITQQPFFRTNWDENLGRNSSKHPLEKLKDIGAVYLFKKEITTIYRKSYMTNEQCFTYKGQEYRCNDLLGYPLFIS